MRPVPVRPSQVAAEKAAAATADRLILSPSHARNENGSACRVWPRAAGSIGEAACYDLSHASLWMCSVKLEHSSRRVINPLVDIDSPYDDDDDDVVCEFEQLSTALAAH